LKRGALFLSVVLLPAVGLSQPDETRPYRMGFSLDSPPLPRQEKYFERFEIWSRRADGNITHSDVPWTRLLRGEPPAKIVREGLLPPLQLMRARGLALFLTLEPLNGLDRSAESPELVVAGRSLVEPEVQRLYRDYAIAVAQVIQPDALGLAAEVNMFRRLGPAPVYQALVRMVHDTITDLRSAYRGLPLYVSVQVETAWGKDIPGGGSYLGVREMRADFPTLDLLGLSTYPLLGFEEPESIPEDYLSRLLDEAGLAGLVSESGWPSSFDFKRTSPEAQAAWIRKLSRLADRARVVFVGQLLFSDFDAFIPIPQGGVLEFFAYQGLVDRDFNPKPALAEWDGIFNRPLRIP
jgi:hypothetical protein